MALEPLAKQGNYFHIYDFRVKPGRGEEFIRLFNEFDYSDANPMHKSAAQVKDGVLCRDVGDPDHFYLVGEWADIEVHAKIRKILAEELRPAFVGLIYPVISLDPKETLGSSAPNLLGPNPSAELVTARSPALHVSKDTPPSFIAAAADDGLVLPANSLHWVTACLAAKASVEAHLFAEGGHGFGLHLPRDLPGSRWPDLFALWMRKHGGGTA